MIRRVRTAGTHRESRSSRRSRPRSTSRRIRAAVKVLVTLAIANGVSGDPAAGGHDRYPEIPVQIAPSAKMTVAETPGRTERLAGRREGPVEAGELRRRGHRGRDRLGLGRATTSLGRRGRGGGSTRWRGRGSRRRGNARARAGGGDRRGGRGPGDREPDVGEVGPAPVATAMSPPAAMLVTKIATRARATTGFRPRRGPLGSRRQPWVIGPASRRCERARRARWPRAGRSDSRRAAGPGASGRAGWRGETGRPGGDRRRPRPTRSTRSGSHDEILAAVPAARARPACRRP